MIEFGKFEKTLALSMATFVLSGCGAENVATEKNAVGRKPTSIQCNGLKPYFNEDDGTTTLVVNVREGRSADRETAPKVDADQMTIRILGSTFVKEGIQLDNNRAVVRLPNITGELSANVTKGSLPPDGCPNIMRYANEN